MNTEQQKVVYISGPMTGLPNFNHAEFDKVENLLVEHGYKVINPAKLDYQEGTAWKINMARTLMLLLESNVDYIATLDGWGNSRGAQLEVHVARELEIEITGLDTLIERATVAFRDKENVYLDGVKRPAFLYSTNPFYRIMYGEFETVKSEYMNQMQSSILMGYSNNATNVKMIEVSKNQALLDELFQSDSKLENFIKQQDIV